MSSYLSKNPGDGLRVGTPADVDLSSRSTATARHSPGSRLVLFGGSAVMAVLMVSAPPLFLVLLPLWLVAVVAFLHVLGRREQAGATTAARVAARERVDSDATTRASTREDRR